MAPVPTKQEGGQILKRCEVAKKFNLGEDVGQFFETLKYSEEDYTPILVIDYLQMNQHQKQLIINFFALRGATIVGTSGTVIKFDNLGQFMESQLALRKAHPWAFYSDPNNVCTTYSRIQTIRTDVITFFSPSKFVTGATQYFEV